MNLHPVLHRIAQPIAAHEFLDALRAATPPRFPHGRSPNPRRVAMAISGGVDSMALAFLCAQIQRLGGNSRIHISDAPVIGYDALIVDHGLREGSNKEAEAVVKAMANMGHRHFILPIRWNDVASNTHPLSDFRLLPGPEPESIITTEPSQEAIGPGHGQVLPSALETSARRLRYRALGLHMMRYQAYSLLLAHHEDDQYETVLMRLLSGHGTGPNGGIRGLRGMRAACDIPECHDMHGVYQSGFIDSHKSRNPYVLLRPSNHQRHLLRKQFRTDVDLATAIWRRDGSKRTTGDLVQQWMQWSQLHHALNSSAPMPPGLDTEDLGIMAYRPLLTFSKDRLVATCTANNVPWFEDKTNADPTLTMRNAVRYVVKNHTLPTALQKPAILQLAARCDAKSRQHEAESRRLIMRHQILVRFDSNVGTMVICVPRIEAKARRRPWKKNRKDSYAIMSAEKRRLHLRTVASLAVQRLLAFVTPETNVTPISNLQTTIDTLFPDLVNPSSSSKSEAATATLSDPKAFTICGVHFMPFIDNATSSVSPYSSPSSSSSSPSSPSSSSSSSPSASSETPSTPRSWYMARAPYLSPEQRPRHVPTIPIVRFHGLTFSQRLRRDPSKWQWPNWSSWELYDGRFWLRIRSRLPDNVFVQPFDKDHSKAFREALAQGPKGPSRLQSFLATLKTYAPGNVRYTLPAIYATRDVTWALERENGDGDPDPYWPEESDAKYYQHKSEPTAEAPGEGLSDIYVDHTVREPGVYLNSGFRVPDVYTWERSLQYEAERNRLKRPDPFRPPGQLLALPTIGYHVPGIEKWLQWEVRYRKVDTGMLEKLAAAQLEKMCLERMYK